MPGVEVELGLLCVVSISLVTSGENVSGLVDVSREEVVCNVVVSLIDVIVCLVLES